MKLYCPTCEHHRQKDIDKYGFDLQKGAYYWTMVPEIKKCCPVKVILINYNSTNVTYSIDNKTFTKNREEFFKSSWRDYDAY